MSDDEYVDLMKDARDAVLRVIDESDPGELTITLTYAYEELAREIERWARAKRGRRKYPLDLHHRGRWWSDMHPAERQRVVLDVLADQRMSITEICEALERQDPDNRWLHYSAMAPTIKKMREAGELQRERETGVGERLVYVYFRSPMSAEVLDLERRLSL